MHVRHNSAIGNIIMQSSIKLKGGACCPLK